MVRTFFPRRGKNACRDNKSVLVMVPVKSLEFYNSCSIVLLCKLHITKLQLFFFFKLLPCLFFVLYLCVYFLFPFSFFWCLLIGSEHFTFEISPGNWGVCLLKRALNAKTAFEPLVNCSSSICEISTISELFLLIYTLEQQTLHLVSFIVSLTKNS